MDSFLGVALTDVATGLPNIPYFRIIQNWEERRARRRKTLVRVIRVAVSGGAEAARRALLWRLCQELRTSDLIASEGRDTFHILLTTPDAENAVVIAERVAHLGAKLEDGALEWLRRHDGREYSFVDATSFAFMRSRRMTEALAFDGDFAAAGFTELRP